MAARKKKKAATPGSKKKRKAASVSRAPKGRVHPDVQRAEDGQRPSDAIYELVRQIPEGRVMTYGQIAQYLLGRVSPRAVGWIMSQCPDDVPWQRVVNAQGACSTDRRGDMPAGYQRKLLEEEGIGFRSNHTLDLNEYRWNPE